MSTHSNVKYKDAIAALTEGISKIALTDVEKRSWRQQLEKQVSELSQFAVIDDDTRAAWSAASLRLRQETRQEEISALPRVTGNLQRERTRLEERKFVLRKCYKSYEQKLVPSESETEARIFGLIGPQGFGKTGLLRYIHAKYAFHDSYLVIHVPAFSVAVKADGSLSADACAGVRKAFYFACSLRNLDFLDVSHYTRLSGLIGAIGIFAENNGLTLLIILDQLRVVEDFRPLFLEISDGLANPRKPHTVIVSSSTSRTSKDVFAPYVNDHVRFQQFTTQPEAEALAEESDVSSEELVSVSFLEAVRLVGGAAKISIAEEAKDYERKWLFGASDLGKAEHMFVFHAVVSGEIIDDADLVLSYVDADTFFWLDDKIMEKRNGLAEMLLRRLKQQKQTHSKYLRFIVDSEYFSKLPQRTNSHSLRGIAHFLVRSQYE